MSDITNEWRELRSKLGDLICHIDGMNESIESKMKKLQEKEEQQADLQAQIDEAYNKGMQDLHEALRIIAAEDGMSVSDLNDAFGVCSVCNIILRFTPEEIIDKALEWKTKQKKEDQELRVGDEVTISGCAGFAYIILYRIYETEDLFKLIEPTSLLTYTYSAKSLTKTGKHYDSIPLPKEIK